MSLKNLLKTRLNEQFIHANVKGAGKFAPRNGFYFIHDVTYRSFGIHGEVPVANTNWKAKHNDLFFEDVTFEIALTSLYPKLGDNFTHIIGKPIEIYDAKIVERPYNGETKHVLNCQWALTNPHHQFTNTQSAVLSAFFGEAKTIGEANNRFEAELGIDLSDALEWEATVSGVDYDEAIYDSDVYDEPTDDDLKPTK